MGRIRTIKPEFPQLEPLGKVTRDARLCFLELKTLADDEGRLRGVSLLLANLLFPYDRDAPDLIESWLDELDRERVIVRYKVDDQSYIQITTWKEDEKIDHPSPSKFPPPPKPREDSREGGEETTNVREDSREGEEGTPNAREASGEDLGPRTEDQGPRTKEAREDAPVNFETFCKKNAEEWKRLGLMPEFRFKTSANLTNSEKENLSVAYDRFTLHETFEAMRNLVKIRGSPEHKDTSDKYKLPGFLATGVPGYLDKADPWTTFARAPKASNLDSYYRDLAKEAGET